MQACLDNNNVTTLTLAVDCLEEARELDEIVRSQAETRLIDDLESEDSKRRQLAAEVRLNQRLKSLRRIDEQREIDLDYITCAEYQLFLDEKRAQGEYYQPDHWTEYTFPKGTGQEPIRGVRAKDAEAFCEWLSQKQGGEIRYRLPQPTEIMDYPPVTVTNNLATWCRTNDGYSLDGLTTEDKLNISLWATGVSKLPFDLNVLDIDHALNHALDTALDSTLDTALTRDLGLAIARALSFENAIARVLAIARDIALYSVLGRALAFVLTIARDRALNRALNRTLNRVLARALALALASALDLALESIYDAMKKQDFQAAKQLAQGMQAESNVVLQRSGTLLHELLVCATATTSAKMEARQAWRQYIARIAEYIWIGYNEQEKLESPWERYLFRRRKSDYSEDKQAILNLYWWLQIVIARKEGKLPAWEGIRIVRERELL